LASSQQMGVPRGSVPTEAGRTSRATAPALLSLSLLCLANRSFASLLETEYLSLSQSKAIPVTDRLGLPIEL
jgi:hypothetical protein